MEAMKKFSYFSRFFNILVLAIFLTAGLLFLSCKSKPVPVSQSEAQPSASLVFSGIEADEPDHLRLSFSLGVFHPSTSAGEVQIESWQVLMEGQDASSAFSMDNPPPGNFPVNSSTPIKLRMDIGALAAKGLAPRDDYSVTLRFNLVLPKSSAPQAKIQVSCVASFPGIQAPKFNITAIAILKAELINTRFRVTMKIDNPNPYSLTLSAFTYTLYGNGQLWANGMARDLVQVDGKSSVQGNLYLMMNFIDMDRKILDQVINLVDVNYRFEGEALVSTGIEYLPAFKNGFDLSGYSKVLDN